MFLTDTQDIRRPYRLAVYNQKSKHLLNFGDDTVFDACWSGNDTITYCTQSPLDATEKLTTVSLSGRALGTVNFQTGPQNLLDLALAYNPASNQLFAIAHASPVADRGAGGQDHHSRLFLVTDGRLTEVPDTVLSSVLAANPVQSQVAVALTDSQTHRIALIDTARQAAETEKALDGLRLPPDTYVTSLVYSPDGRRVLITVHKNSFPNYSDILLYDINTDALTPVVRGTFGTLSPDGKSVAYVGMSRLKGSGPYFNEDRVYTCRVGGGDVKLIDGGGMREAPDRMVIRLLIWVVGAFVITGGTGIALRCCKNLRGRVE